MAGLLKGLWATCQHSAAYVVPEEVAMTEQQKEQQGGLFSNTDQADWGLAGWSKLMANLGAIGVVCMLLVFSFYTLRETHREDVSVFREEMREFRGEMRAQRDHDADMRRQTNHQIGRNQQSLEETLRLVASLAKDVAMLAAEVRFLKKGPS